MASGREREAGRERQAHTAKLAWAVQAGADLMWAAFRARTCQQRSQLRLFRNKGSAPQPEKMVRIPCHKWTPPLYLQGFLAHKKTPTP